MPTISTNIRKTTFGSKYSWSSFNPGGTTTAENRTLSWVDTRTDEGPVRGYKQRVSSVQDATSTLTGFRQSYECRPGSFRVRFKRKPGQSVSLAEEYGNEHSGDMCQSSTPSIGSPSTLEADGTALMKFLAEARQAYTALQGGVVLGEIGQTLNMIRHPAKAFRTGIDSYFADLKRHRKMWKNGKNRFLADTWLEYSFGWTPLLNDIRQGSLALERIRKRSFSHQTIRSIGRSKTLGPSEDLIQFMEGGHRYDGYRFSFNEAIVVYRGAVKVPIGTRAVMTRQNLGFTLDNFVPTVWELIPYSFLVDYFTNIGDVLSAWSAWNIDFAWKNRTVISRRVQQNVLNRFVSLNYNSAWYDVTQLNLSPCQSTVELRNVSRASYPGPLMPTFRFEIPGMDSLKWLNLAALATSRSALTPF